MNTLLLFDIDGTLILNSTAGLTAYLRALKNRFGVQLTTSDIAPACGKTDFIILRELLDTAGLEQESPQDPKLIALYLEHLHEALQEDPGTIAQGTVQFLESLANEKDMFLALGTGNLAEGARIKLAHHRLDHFFSTGGFAEDGATREELVAQGLAKAQCLFKTTFDKVVVIGDTPRDIACAQDNNFHSIAVATGSFSAQELRDARADRVLNNLENTQEIISIIRGLS
mgnify:CR=1 FL=1|jgi:phosphoglycolate phosphatase-like HAD superfamily hydrolase